MCCSVGVGPFALVIDGIGVGVGAGQVFAHSSFDIVGHHSAGIMVRAHVTIDTTVK